jgi:hypothetical protein
VFDKLIVRHRWVAAAYSIIMASSAGAVVTALNLAAAEHQAEVLRCIHERLVGSGVSGEDAAQLVGNPPPVVFTEASLAKKTRQRNPVPWYDRCSALCAGGGRCTRRRQDGTLFCGTHAKGQPHGRVDSTPETDATRVSVFAEDVSGILQWLDDAGNVYSQEDIYANLPNPRVIARYTRVDGGIVLAGD